MDPGSPDRSPTSQPASAGSSHSCCGCPPRRPSAAGTAPGSRGRWPRRTAGRCSPPRPCSPPLPETPRPGPRTRSPLLTAACSADPTLSGRRAPGDPGLSRSPRHRRHARAAASSRGRRSSCLSFDALVRLHYSVVLSHRG